MKRLLALALLIPAACAEQQPYPPAYYDPPPIQDTQLILMHQMGDFIVGSANDTSFIIYSF